MGERALDLVVSFEGKCARNWQLATGNWQVASGKRQQHVILKTDDL